jgi:hypothetical protein
MDGQNGAVTSGQPAQRTGSAALARLLPAVGGAAVIDRLDWSAARSTEKPDSATPQDANRQRSWLSPLVAHITSDQPLLRYI